ncbi:hypothetical protein M9458_020070, partial [Cirrhinus mrigala]
PGENMGNKYAYNGGVYTGLGASSLAVPFLCSILANPDVYPSNSFASLPASLLSAE